MNTRIIEVLIFLVGYLFYLPLKKHIFSFNVLYLPGYLVSATTLCSPPALPFQIEKVLLSRGLKRGLYSFSMVSSPMV
jgi:hypothetical protein